MNKHPSERRRPRILLGLGLAAVATLTPPKAPTVPTVVRVKTTAQAPQLGLVV